MQHQQQVAICPNKYNPYHQCNSYCQNHMIPLQQSQQPPIGYPIGSLEKHLVTQENYDKYGSANFYNLFYYKRTWERRCEKDFQQEWGCTEYWVCCCWIPTYLGYFFAIVFDCLAMLLYFLFFPVIFLVAMLYWLLSFGSCFTVSLNSRYFIHMVRYMTFHAAYSLFTGMFVFVVCFLPRGLQKWLRMLCRIVRCLLFLLQVST